MSGKRTRAPARVKQSSPAAAAERAIVQALEEGAAYRPTGRGNVLCGQICHLLPRDEVYRAHQGRILFDPVELLDVDHEDRGE